MPSPVLIPSLRKLWDNFDDVAPNRDRSSDGWIGDAAHRKRSSSHNPDESGSVPVHDTDKTDEVHALDVDADLRKPGLTMQGCINAILSSPTDRARLRYVIFNRRIIRASNGWREWEEYDGENPHTGHAHFDGSYESAREADTRDWAITGGSTDVELKELMGYKYGSPNILGEGKTLSFEDWSKGGEKAARKADTILSKLDVVLANLSSLTGKDFVDEDAIVKGVLNGLGAADVEDIAAALRASIDAEKLAALKAIL